MTMGMSSRAGRAPLARLRVTVTMPLAAAMSVTPAKRAE